MTRMRIAHFSDTHVLSLKGVQLRALLNKRITGAVNLVFNRAKHYRVEVFEELLEVISLEKKTYFYFYWNVNFKRYR